MRSILPWVGLSLVLVKSAPAGDPLTQVAILQASTTTFVPPLTTAGFATTDPNAVDWNMITNPSQMDPSGQNVQPIRKMNDGGILGASIGGPQNVPLQYEGPDLLAPPSTDHGSVGNAKWSMSQSPNRLQTGGWARQQNKDFMPIATTMAGVNMRLLPGAVRELHWHTTAEWAYVLKGTTRITAVNADSQNYIADVHEGDLWYFPPGVPHALQALNDTGADGTEFLLVFDSGDFSEDSTLLITDWMAHIPKEVIAKNFQANQSIFDHIPANELYIFPTAVPKGLEQVRAEVPAPNGTPTEPLSYEFSKIDPTKYTGGSVKIADSSTFLASKTIAVAEVVVLPGHMRELHWHPTEPEWAFFITGLARVTLFSGSGNSKTFNYAAGDVGYVPPSFGHYVENIGNTTLKYLEIFNAPRYQDISLTQWLALTPPDLVSAHLNLDPNYLKTLNKTKQVVV